jgi:aldehyde dehydrogenase (NAD+)
VHESLFDDLVNGIQAALDFLKIGDPADPSVTLGPLISAAQRSRVESLVKIGQDEGGQVAYGGGRPANQDKGFFFEPTVFVDMDNSMTLARREIFGPVGVIIPFRDEDEAVRIANDSDFGLGGGVWAKDPVKAFNVARRLRTGQVIVNGGGGGGLNPDAPFGGYKQSGLGREWGAAGMEEYLQTKAITWSAGNPA